MRIRTAVLAVLLALAAAATGLRAQSTLERSPLLGSDWVGFPWAAEVSLRTAFDGGPDSTLDADPSFQAALGLTTRQLVGVRFTPEPSGAAGIGPAAVEGFARARLWSQDQGGPLDLTAELLAGRSMGETAIRLAGHAGRWFGPLRLMATAGAEPSEDPEIGLGGGVVWHPLPGTVPIALAGDLSARPWEDGSELAWSAGVQVGLSFTPHTLSLFATNASTTRGGEGVATGQVRAGVELTASVPVGRFIGVYAPRQTAAQSVRPVERGDVAPAPAAVAEGVVTVPIREYRYAPQRLVVEAGSVVEWVNEDAVMHTATADDGAWSSGAIPPGERWSATFDEPGIYPYHCGPHPFMRGVVIVR